MAPTLTWLDSFEHQNLGVASYGTNAGLYDTQNNTSKMSFVTGRLPTTHAVQIVQDAVTAARLGKTVAAGNRTVVESFYFRITAAPSVTSNFWQGIATVTAQVGMDTTGHVQWNAGSGSNRTSSGTYADGQWHRIDLKLVTSATPYTLDIYIDGTSQTQQVSNATTAADISETRIGSNNAAHTLTVQIADWVRSLTAGDYPIGPHRCVQLLPTADGTHSWASTHMGDQAGLVASSTSTLHNDVDEFPPDATDYIQAGTSTTSTEYAEIVMDDVASGLTVWAARAVAAILSQGTASNSATTRIVNGVPATILDLYTGDQSDTTIRVQAAILPGITSDTLVNALKYRVGFPTDSNPAPWWAALMFDYATPLTEVFPGLISSTGQVYAPTVTFAETAGFISSAGVVYAPTITESLAGAFINSAGQVYAPSITESVTGAFIASASQVFAPTVTASVTPGFIDSSGVVYAPALTFAETAAFIDSTGYVYAPVVTVASTLAAPFIDSTGYVFTPVVMIQVGPTFLGPSGVVYAPGLSSPVGPMTFIDATAYVFSPTALIARSLVQPYIPSPGYVLAPAVSFGLRPGLLGPSGVIYAPAIDRSYHVLPAVLVDTGVVFTPGIVFAAEVVPHVPHDPSIDGRRRLKRQGLGPKLTRRVVR